MPVGAIVILVEWLLIVVGGLTFLVVHGRPWRAVDKMMSWHIAALTAVATAEPVGLVLAGLSLWPSLVIYTSSVAVMYWRVGLLIQTRRRVRRQRHGGAP